MTIEIVSYQPSHEADWDEFCSASANANFLHTRRFLSYHGHRFCDASSLVFADGNIVGLFPAALISGSVDEVVSHPGATYGGIVHKGWLAGTRMIDAMVALCGHYNQMGAKNLVYKAIPFIYSNTPAQDDLYALFRLGAMRTRCDLSCAIDLSDRRRPSERRRRGLKKSQSVVTVANDIRYLPSLYRVIESNLLAQHNAKPVHTLTELSILRDRFPEQVVIRVGLIEGEVQAGIVLFNANRVWHAQYIASSDVGYKVSALDAVFEAAIFDAKAAGARFFDFGTSNGKAGAFLNDGLYRYKSEFGGGGVAHEFYELDLAK